MRKIGLHLRLQDRVSELFKRAQSLDIGLFQCFFIFQTTGKLISPSPEDIAECRAMSSLFSMLILHGSYWINLASHQTRHRALERELNLAKKFGFTHLVLHSGSARGSESREQSIDYLARSLNDVLKNEQDIQIVLENTAHGGMAIGSDLQDFYLLKEKLEYPEKIKFCIDTAHAFSYGYDICNITDQNAFINLLDTTIGIDSIVLIHMNDLVDRQGSRLDRHAIPGMGSLGQEVLQRFVKHPLLSHIPLILELPLVSEQEELEILQQIINWHK